MDTILYNQELKRMNRDVHRMREQIDTLKEKLRMAMVARTNLIYSETYTGGV